MVDLLVKLVLAYLLGSVIGSLVVGKLKGGVDIRTQGSGNAGGTNALRTQGKVFAFWVMLIDVGKGVLAAAAVPHLPAVFGAAFVHPEWIPALCGALAVVGHVYPVFFGFRGGKGAATFVGALGTLAPLALLPGLAVWALMLMLTGYVGLSTVLAAFAVAVYALIVSGAASPFFAFALAMACFILFTHRSNMQRLLAGKENRFERARLLHRRG